MKKTIHIARVLGMCAGVRRALEAVEEALRTGGTVYVFHEIVHNGTIVADLRSRGVKFVDSLGEIPAGGTVIFSAHGVSQNVEAEAAARGLRVIDATCPLVKKIHRAASAAAESGAPVILIGHQGHPEVEGTLGQCGGEMHLIESADDIATLPDFARPPVVLAQTTLEGDFVATIRDQLAVRYGQIEDGGGICYATSERQSAVRELAAKCELVLVLGSPNSSNSNRLREVAERAGARALLIECAADLPPDVLNDVSTVGITAGASTPDAPVAELAAVLQK